MKESSEKLHQLVGRELLASIVVFLVALPLCMGIAIASGVDPALGLITGVVGGLVVGFFAGQPLQVSGPAAGLVVLCLNMVEEFGLSGLALAVLLGGFLQLIAGFLKIGRWFRAVSPSVILGMLSGIGVLIFASQFHVMLDDPRKGKGWENLLSIPKALYSGFFPLDGSQHHLATLTGIVTISSLLLWQRFRPQILHAVPGTLVGVVGGSVLAGVTGLSINFVEVPSNLFASLGGIDWNSASMLQVPKFWINILGLALIASAETLLCATAVDRMHSGPRTHYDQELKSQGIGNMICGALGVLPMTGVIVRSSANVEAGAKTRLSAILHGVWLLLLVVVFPQVLELIPTSALAAILVYTGYKLFNLKGVLRLARAKSGRSGGGFIIWVGTVVTIVATDLLIGVVVGIVLSLIALIYQFTHLAVSVRIDEEKDRYDVVLNGSATFLTLPLLAEKLESIPSEAEVHVHIQELAYIDHACFELLEDWRTRHQGEVFMESATLAARNNGSRSLQHRGGA